jgi:hypothetical protein
MLTASVNPINTGGQHKAAASENFLTLTHLK